MMSGSGKQKRSRGRFLRNGIRLGRGPHASPKHKGGSEPELGAGTPEVPATAPPETQKRRPSSRGPSTDRGSSGAGLRAGVCTGGHPGSRALMVSHYCRDESPQVPWQCRLRIWQCGSWKSERDFSGQNQPVGRATPSHKDSRGICLLFQLRRPPCSLIPGNSYEMGLELWQRPYTSPSSHFKLTVRFCPDVTFSLPGPMRSSSEWHRTEPEQVL